MRNFLKIFPGKRPFFDKVYMGEAPGKEIKTMNREETKMRVYAIRKDNKGKQVMVDITDLVEARKIELEKQRELERPIRYCRNCGKRMEHGYFYCSKECCDEYRKKNRKKEKDEERVCPVCGKTFMAEKWRK